MRFGSLLACLGVASCGGHPPCDSFATPYLLDGGPPSLPYLTDRDGRQIQHANEATCLVDRGPGQGACGAGPYDVPRCAFRPERGDDCPAVGSSPGAVAASPCWYVCDAGTHAWQLRVCFDTACEPDSRPRASNYFVGYYCRTGLP